MNTQTQVVSDNLAAVAKAKAERTEVANKLASIGLDDAKSIHSESEKHMQAYGVFVRDIMKKRAKELQGDESRIRDYLSGFRKGFPKSGDTRASEAGTIIRAYSKDAEKVEGFKGGYAPLVDFCRTINGKKDTGSRVSGPRAPSDKGLDAIQVKIAAMKPQQAEAVASQAVRQIVATNPKDWELHLLRQIDHLTVQLAKSTQPIYQDLAKEVQDVCADALNKDAIESAKLTAQAQKDTGTVTAPTMAQATEPAEKQQKAA